jgi:hypothetical protein
MSTVELLETVRQAWGPEVSREFAAWLEEHLSAAGLAPGVQISAFVARQKVNVLMLERVSHLLLTGEPTLARTASGEWVWRVPVDLTFPSHGRVGCVGEIEVEARYGGVRYTEALLAQMADAAEQLAQQVLHPKP